MRQNGSKGRHDAHVIRLSLLPGSVEKQIQPINLESYGAGSD